MKFANFEYLFLFALLIPYIVWYVKDRMHSTPSVRMSSLESFQHAPKSFRQRFIHLPFILRILALSAAILALARPQTSDHWSQENMEGIDIVLCMDVSTSMLAEDLKPNRLEAAKKVALEFINSRPNDNIGLTVFAGEAYTQCPMTIDHAVLLNLFHALRVDMAQRGLIEDGTAIGTGLANAISRLKESKAKSKVIILLTDGTNNRGQISPNTAAEIAKSFGIRIYTIGVGKNGTAPYPMLVAGRVQYVNVPVEIDDKSLASIAAQTEGKFYRAENVDELRSVYHEIDQLEKTKMNVKKYSKKNELYHIFALVALLSLFVEILLRKTLLQRFP